MCSSRIRARVPGPETRTDWNGTLTGLRVVNPNVWGAEVLSPSTAARDRGVKVRLNARAGVQGAWIVDPEAETIEVHDLGRKKKRVFAAGAQAVAKALRGFQVDVAALFAVSA